MEIKEIRYNVENSRMTGTFTKKDNSNIAYSVPYPYFIIGKDLKSKKLTRRQTQTYIAEQLTAQLAKEII